MRRSRTAHVAAAAVGALLLVGPGAAVASPPGVAAPPRAEARTSMPGVWWYDAMALDDVHAVATGKGVKVAVIDGYLDPEVPDLRGAQISKGTGCRGAATPYLSGDVADHGTAMTTAIVGQGTGNAAGGKGVVGVAPDAQLRFFSFDTDPDQSLVECDAVLIAKQVDKAVAWGADVISMSIGTGGGLEDSIEKAWDSGAVVVAASGAVGEGEKRGEVSFENPAAMPGVVAVAAADSSARVWSQNPESADFADQYLTVAAPGVETQIGGFPRGQGWTSGATRTGTSGATAITAGAFAVLKSRWPEATGNQLIQAVIHHTGRNDTGGLVFDKRSGYGILSLKGTLEVDPTGYPDENPLLKTPSEAAEAYPASSYDASGDQAGDDSGDGAATDAGAAADQEPVAAADAGSSVPVWAVGLGVVVLAALGGGALLLRRRSAGGSA